MRYLRFWVFPNEVSAWRGVWRQMCNISRRRVGGWHILPLLLPAVYTAAAVTSSFSPVRL